MNRKERRALAKDQRTKLVVLTPSAEKELNDKSYLFDGMSPELAAAYRCALHALDVQYDELLQQGKHPGNHYMICNVAVGESSARVSTIPKTEASIAGIPDDWKDDVRASGANMPYRVFIHLRDRIDSIRGEYGPPSQGVA